MPVLEEEPKHDTMQVKYAARYSLLSPIAPGAALRDVLLGPLRVQDSSDARILDADDVLDEEQRARVSAVAWRCARAWHTALPIELGAVAWLCEYPLGQLMVGTLRVARLIAQVEAVRGAGAWRVPVGVCELLRHALARTDFTPISTPLRSATDGIGHRSRAGVRASTIARALRAPTAAGEAVMVLPGGGVNALLQAPGARSRRFVFLADRLPPRGLLVRLAFRYEVASVDQRPQDADERLDFPVCGWNAATASDPVAARALPHLLPLVRGELHAAVAAFHVVLERALAPSAVLIPDDATPIARGIVAASALRGVPVAVVQHGALVAREDGNHLTAGSTLAWGDALPQLLASEVADPPVATVIGLPGRGIHGRTARRRRRPTVLFIGTAGHASNLALPPIHQQALLDALASELSSRGRAVELLVRPHHSGGAPIVYPKRPGLTGGISRAGDLGGAIRRASLIVTTFSTVVIEASHFGVPVIACPGFMSDALQSCRSIPGILWCDDVAAAAREAADVLEGGPFSPTQSTGPEYVREFVGWDRLSATLRNTTTEPRDRRVGAFGDALRALLGLREP